MKYTKPVMELVKFDSVDVMTTSEVDSTTSVVDEAIDNAIDFVEGELD